MRSRGSWLEVDAGHGPTNAWSYTNVGWCLLGHVIETVSNASWEDAMRLPLFDGLGMGEHAIYGTSPVRVGADPAMKSRRVVRFRSSPLVSRAYGPAGTTVISTASDLLQFAALHLEDPTLAAMRVKHAEVSNPRLAGRLVPRAGPGSTGRAVRSGVGMD